MSDQFQGESAKGSLKINLSTSVHEMCTRNKYVYMLCFKPFFFQVYIFFVLGGMVWGKEEEEGG